MHHCLLEIIVCPVCHGKLNYNKDNFELTCNFDHLAYPIRNGIPVLLKNEARQLPLDDRQ
ncbi:hypothetical protein GFV14_00651 [Candidatus Hartigia pinicola]|nr:hypothetical protein GFV14_00651 [Candidatus Hartigia pinicola]